MVNQTPEERIAALEASVSTLSANLAALQSYAQQTRADATAAIVALQGRVSNTEQALANAGTRLSAVEGAATAIADDLALTKTTVGERLAQAEVAYEQLRGAATEFAQSTDERFELARQAIEEARTWAGGLTDDLRAYVERLDSWREQIETALRRGQVTPEGHLTILDVVGRELGVEPRAFREVIKRLVSDMRNQR